MIKQIKNVEGFRRDWHKWKSTKNPEIYQKLWAVSEHYNDHVSSDDSYNDCQFSQISTDLNGIDCDGIHCLECPFSKQNSKVYWRAKHEGNKTR